MLLNLFIKKCIIANLAPHNSWTAEATDIAKTRSYVIGNGCQPKIFLPEIIVQE